MNEAIEKDLIHPITRGTYKEPVYKDFVSREEFINQTGIFVSPDYFGYIYDIEYKKAGISVEEFVRDYEENIQHVFRKCHYKVFSNMKSWMTS